MKLKVDLTWGGGLVVRGIPSPQEQDYNLVDSDTGK